MNAGWAFRRAIEEVWHLLMTLKWYDLQHIYWEGNVVVDVLATMGMKIHGLH